MKTYKIKVTFKDGKYKYIFANEIKLRKSINVLNYCFKKFGKESIKEIKTRGKNSSGGYYWDLNYNLFFENALKNHFRIEATNKPGFRDYRGYGAKTDGLKNRFYVGRSTGWVPIYLEVLNSNSSGGSALFLHKRKFKIV